MALHFSLTDIRDYVHTCYHTATGERPDGPDWFRDDDVPGLWLRRKALTTVLIFKCMSVGLRGIEEGNLAEWFFRTRLSNAFAVGHDLVGTDAEGNRFGRNVTEAEIRSHIGLRTNVAKEGRKAWAKRLLDYEFAAIEKRVLTEAARKERRDEAVRETA